MVGSLGRLGILAELSFKVFPKPVDYLTARIDERDFSRGLARLQQLARQPLELDALELERMGRWSFASVAIRRPFNIA